MLLLLSLPLLLLLLQAQLTSFSDEDGTDGHSWFNSQLDALCAVKDPRSFQRDFQTRGTRT